MKNTGQNASAVSNREFEGSNLSVAWGTHVGKVRSNNEDSMVVSGRPDGAVLMVVADGLGGQAAGEVASALAVATLEAGFQQAEHPGEALEGLVEDAHLAILNASDEDAARKGMSTTCTAIVIQDEEYWTAHVGDSRLYMSTGKRLYQLTQDHTWARSLHLEGNSQFVPMVAKNVLTRCLGSRKSFSVDATHAKLGPDDQGFLLCSDGLYGQVTDDRCYDLWSMEPPSAAVLSLVQAALDGGGPDNVTTIVAQFTR